MARKNILIGLGLAGSLWLGGGTEPFWFSFPAVAQTTQAADDMFYLYRGQRIPLQVSTDTIAVAGKPQDRSVGSFSIRLQQHLQAGSTRSEDNSNVMAEVSPLGASYALVSVSPNNQGQLAQIQNDIAAFAETETILPVLTRQDTAEALVLPNEIVASFDLALSEAQVQDILTSQGLSIVRPLRFSQNRYLVRSNTASGVAVLEASNRLYETAGVRSSTPNFIPAGSSQVVSNWQSLPQHPSLSQMQPDSVSLATGRLKAASLEFPTKHMPLLWHIDSRAMLHCFNIRQLNFTCLQQPLDQAEDLPRTDLHVPEAWQLGQDGEGVVVAVIDSLVQWDHPNLKDSLYQISNPACPGEVSGWDFSNNAIDPTSQSSDCLGDGDTRISASEVSQLRGFFQDTFRLADSELLQKYPRTAASLRTAGQCAEASAKCSDEAVAMGVRRQLRSRVTSEFHGTTVAGVIVARPVQENGIVGVAPRAKLLPIRAIAIGQPGPSIAAAIEAIGYATARGADVINMSWGGRLPNEDLESAIADLLATNSTIVLVASAGNDGTSDDLEPDQVRYPSALEGVIAVGATNLKGERAYYSNYGRGLDVVAPGGDFQQGVGFLSTGGTFISAFWQGIGLPDVSWDNSFDQRGVLTWTQGTSFASPAVAGVVALIKAEDTSGQLTREQVTQLLKQTATYEGLDTSQESAPVPANTSSEVYFFGSGLVNAAAAVQAAQEASR